MSRETSAWLNTNTLIGFTDERGTAWHYRADDQGTEPNHYPGPIPIEDVQRRLFGWEAVESIKIAVTYRTPGGMLRTKVDHDRKAIIRADSTSPGTDSIFEYFKHGYQIHQYRQWLLKNFGLLLDSDLRIGSAGLLDGGARAWVQVEMPGSCDTPEGVRFRPFLSGATSLDGTLSTTYVRGAQLVVCDNTLSAALTEPGTGRIKIRHSRNSLGSITQVRQALDIVHQVEQDFARQITALCQIPVSDRQWDRFLAVEAAPGRDTKHSRARADRKRADLEGLWRHDERVAPWAGTAYGVVAAINTYTHHLKTVRGSSRADRNAERAITGGVDKLDSKTVQVLNQILDNALAHAT
ncbi:DUF932 domain-containing protein [Actinomadura graeca]|uniref:DUF932 domain-containing protein n=1 Tax=Actinomadura graeca TaxID=2750812 RepID=A0ABX8R867_9ACTN|nr:DUF932 domain-containing protein [Actinomadura graeca]QXJ25962.1 DUF932 domain-containing protein [Actinomadura graeca]